MSNQRRIWNDPKGREERLPPAEKKLGRPMEMEPTYVVEMTLGTTIFCWLCAHCEAARKAAGWTVKRHKAVAFGCDQCHRELERYRNAVSPPVDYVETAPESFCPPPGWVAPAVPETWAARLAEKKAAR